MALFSKAPESGRSTPTGPAHGRECLASPPMLSTLVVFVLGFPFLNPINHQPHYFPLKLVKESINKSSFWCISISKNVEIRECFAFPPPDSLSSAHKTHNIVYFSGHLETDFYERLCAA